MHLFAGGYPGRYGTLFPKGGDLAVYDAIRGVHEIDRALVVGYEGDPWAKGNNRYIARLAKAHTWISPVAFCTTARPLNVSTLEKWWQDGFCGIALYLGAEADADSVLAWSDEVVAALNAKRAIISINVPVTGIDRLRPLFQRISEAQILISHLGLPGAVSAKTSDKSAARTLAPLLRQADLANVGVKVSAFYACNAFPHAGIAPVVDALGASFGTKRLYWGSDFSPALDDVSFPQTIEAVQAILGTGFSKTSIFHDNLNRILKGVR